MRLFTVILLILVTNFGGFSQKNEIEDGWRGILPIKSNLVMVEKELGQPQKINGNYYLYDTENAVINIAYSGEPCTGKDFGKFNVPKDTVLNISVGLKNRLLIADLNWEKDKYQRSGKIEIGETAEYWNYKNKISITVVVPENGEEEVSTIFYYPPQKDEKILCKCKESQNN